MTHPAFFRRKPLIATAALLAVGASALAVGSAANAASPITGTMKIYSSTTWSASGEFVLKNSSSTASDWSLSFRVPNGEFLNHSSWNTSLSKQGDIVTLKPLSALGAGATANISFGISGNGTNDLEIVGCDLDGHGVTGCVVGETGDIEAPSYVENITASAVTPRTVDLTWGASSDNVGVTEYRIFDGQNPEPVKRVPGDTTKTTIDGLSPETGYGFHVFAYDAAGNHSGSSITYVETPAESGEEHDSTAPSYVGRLSAVATSPTTASLEWDAATDNVGVTSYQVFDGTRKVADLAGDTTRLELGDLVPEKTYAFHVFAFDAAGNHGGGTVTALTMPTDTDRIAPTVPMGLTAHTVDEDTVHVMWEHATDNVKVTDYKVYQDGRAVKTVPASMRMIDIDGLSADTKYGFQVTALDGAGNESDKTAVVTGSTAPGVRDTEDPTDVTCIEGLATGSSTIDLSWTPASDNVGVAKYVISADGKDLKTVAGDAVSTTLTGLKADTKYGLQVRAFDAAGNHGGSVTFDITTKAEKPGTGTPAPADFEASSSTFNDGGRTLHRLDLQWTPSETTSRYEIRLDGKTTQTLLVGANASAVQKRQVLLGQNPAATIDVQLRAQLANGTWSDWSAVKTVATVR